MLIPITLKNTFDSTLINANLLKENKIRMIRVDAIVEKDWKCRLVIPKQLQNLLNLPTKVNRTVFFSKDFIYSAQMAEALEVKIQNRGTTVCPFVMPKLHKIVIGSILLEELNLEVNAVGKLEFLEKFVRI